MAECGARGHDIVHQHEALPPPLVRNTGMVDALSVPLSCLAHEARLWRAVLGALQQLHHGQSRRLRHPTRQHRRLVVAAPPPPPPRQRHRYQCVHTLPEVLLLSLHRRPLAQFQCQVAPAMKLDVDDEFVVGRVVIVGKERGCALHLDQVPYQVQQLIVLDVLDAVAWQPDGAEGTEHILALHQQLAANGTNSRQQQFV